MASGGGARFAGVASARISRARGQTPQPVAAVLPQPAATRRQNGKQVMGNMYNVPDEVKALWLVVGIEVAFLLWHRRFFKTAHGG